MRCEERFYEIYGKDPVGISFFPYRICPIGAHSKLGSCLSKETASEQSSTLPADSENATGRRSFPTRA